MIAWGSCFLSNARRAPTFAEQGEFGEEQIRIFGEVIARLADEIEENARAELSRRLAHSSNAPVKVVQMLAFDDSIVHPQTLIDDKPTAFGDYEPKNFDRAFQGTVSIAQALQMSLNVPAVALLDGVGASRLNARISQAGGTLVNIFSWGIGGEAMGRQPVQFVADQSDCCFQRREVRIGQAVINRIQAGRAGIAGEGNLYRRGFAHHSCTRFIVTPFRPRCPRIGTR